VPAADATFGNPALRSMVRSGWTCQAELPDRNPQLSDERLRTAGI
jgi:hypothetical protein